MHHKRILQEKNKLIADLKGWDAHAGWRIILAIEIWVQEDWLNQFVLLSLLDRKFSPLHWRNIHIIGLCDWEVKHIRKCTLLLLCQQDTVSVRLVWEKGSRVDFQWVEVWRVDKLVEWCPQAALVRQCTLCNRTKSWRKMESPTHGPCFLENCF